MKEVWAPDGPRRMPGFQTLQAIAGAPAPNLSTCKPSGSAINLHPSHLCHCHAQLQPSERGITACIRLPHAPWGSHQARLPSRRWRAGVIRPNFRSVATLEYGMINAPPHPLSPVPRGPIQRHPGLEECGGTPHSLMGWGSGGPSRQPPTSTPPHLRGPLASPSPVPHALHPGFYFPAARDFGVTGLGSCITAARPPPVRPLRPAPPPLESRPPAASMLGRGNESRDGARHTRPNTPGAR